MPLQRKICTATLSQLNIYYNNFKGMRIQVKKIKGKGLGVVAQEDINKGIVFAYYRTNKISNKNLSDKYKCENYTVHVSQRSVGVMDSSLLFGTFRNIPYVGAYLNEPTYVDDVNCTMSGPLNVPNTNFIDYKLTTTRYVKKGEELCWCYGPDYIGRSYNTQCSKIY
tara:strand:- start:8259 stop:8759 length:501 start_codon:yes stop_codon:yes gene_type:complete